MSNHNFQWINGFYTDSSGNKLSNAQVLAYKNSYNAEFNLSSDSQSLDLEQSRQYISFSLSSDVSAISFNHDIFGKDTLSNNNGSVVYNRPYDNITNLPYVEFEDYFGNTKAYIITEFKFTSYDTISISLPALIKNCISIKFVSYKPYSIPKYTNRLTGSFSVNNYESVGNNNLIDINNDDQFDLGIGKIHIVNNSLVLLSRKNVIITEKIFSDIESPNGIVFLYQTKYNDQNVNFDDWENINGGLYYNQNGIIRRVIFAKIKSPDYYSSTNPTLSSWLSQQSSSIFNNETQPVNIDDFESLNYVLADKVSITKLEIETAEKNTLLPTPNPTTSITPTISKSPSATPRTSPEPSQTPIKFDYVYQWSARPEDNIPTIVDDVFRKSDIATFYKTFYTGDDHAIVEVSTQRSSRVFLPFGINDTYQAGFNLSNPQQEVRFLNYTINNIFQDPYKISLGNKFNYVINRDSNIFRWGDNTYGQLSSLEDGETIIQFPRRLDTNKYIDVSAGIDHAFLINDKHEIHYSGSVHGKSSQVFISYFDDEQLNKDWEKVFSCQNLTFAKKINDEKLYLIGGKYKDKILDGSEIIVVDDSVADMKKFAIGPDHAFILRSDNTLSAFGDNSQNQLGRRFLEEAQNFANYNNKAIWNNKPIASPTPTTTETISIELNDVSPTPTPTLTRSSEGITATPTPTIQTDPQVLPPPTPTVTASTNSDPTPTPTATTSTDANPTPTPTASSSSDFNPSPTPTATPQLTQGTATPTPSISLSSSNTPSISFSPTNTPSISVSISQSSSADANPYDVIYTVGNIGSTSYTINGSANPNFTLVRGASYLFNINSPGHPFWIKTVNSTGTGNAYNNGVTNNGTDSGQIIFNVPLDAPSILYYACQFHSSMNGTMIVDSPVSTLEIVEGGKPTTVGTNGRSSYYGTYDQNGNMDELVYFSTYSKDSEISILGGSYKSSAEELTQIDRIQNVNSRSLSVGFRIAASYDINTYSPDISEEFIQVLDVNNSNDAYNFGAVSYGYSISKYLTTNDQYVEFLNYNLNAIDLYALWEDANSDLQGIYYDGEKYVSKPNMGSKPVNYLILSNVLRYINWRYNNLTYRKNHGKLDSGIYELDSTLSLVGFGIEQRYEAPTDISSIESIFAIQKRGPYATDKFIWLPDINEWYKSAYYNAELKEYTKYATNSNNLPTEINYIDDMGNGDSGGRIYNSNEFFVSINDNLEWEDVSAGDGYSLGISGGKLYGWGSNEDQLLSSVTRLSNISEPTIIYDGVFRSVDTFNKNNIALGANALNVIDDSILVPTNTPTLTPSVTTTQTPTATLAPTPTQTPSVSVSLSSSKQANPALPALSPTPTPTLSISLTPTLSGTPKNTPTNTPTNSLSETPFATKTPTPTKTRTSTPTPTTTPPASPTASITVTPSKTSSVFDDLNAMRVGCYNYRFDPKQHIYYSTAFSSGDRIPENGTITRNNPLVIGNVANGAYVDVRAWGTITIGWGCDPYTPDGSVGCPGLIDVWGQNPSSPLMGRLGDDPIFRVGSTVSFRNTSGSTQPFIIFFTDIQSSDNRGYYDIAVNISGSGNTSPPCVTPNLTPGISSTPTITPTKTKTPSVTPSNTHTPTKTTTATSSPHTTTTATPTKSNTPTVTSTNDVDVTPTVTPTKSNTPTVTKTVTSTNG